MKLFSEKLYKKFPLYEKNGAVFETAYGAGIFGGGLLKKVTFNYNNYKSVFFRNALCFGETAGGV